MIYIDFETKSPVDIRASGAWVYSEHPETDVHCMAYAVDDEPVRIWTPWDDSYDNEEKDRLFDLIKYGELVEAHNALFERAIWQNIMVPRYDWPEIKPEQWRCSAAKAAARALPRSLENVGAVLHLKTQKNMLGKRVMMKLCRPRLDGTYWTPEIAPEDFAVLYDYCKQDVEVERELNKEVRDLHPDELKVWQLDQTINARGIMLDIEAVEACLKMVRDYEKKLLKEVNQITKGALQNVSQRDKAIQWLSGQGLLLDNLTKKTVSETLENGDGLPPEVLRLLEIRQELGRTSTAKLAAMQQARCKDGRIRDTLMYHGAGTGRWSGKLVQLHNMPRGTVSDTDRAIELIKKGDYELVEMFYGDVMATISSCLRGMLIASPGMELIVADYAAIEARVLFWLANETRGMQMFRDGVDLYLDMAKTIYSRENVGKAERPLGKQAILGCGYGMGRDKFQITCENYGIKIPPAIAERAVTAYREKYATVQCLWWDQERAAIKAAKSGQPVNCGKVTWFMHEKTLYCKLPSKRCLSYNFPSVKVVETPWGAEKEQLSYFSVNSVSKKWEQEPTYGGKLVENITQAVARDLMASAMLRVEAAGYPVVLTVHDELVAEVPEGFGSVEEFENLMAEAPEWGADCPIKAEGWRGKRYRK